MTAHGDVEIARARAARARHELSGTMEQILSRFTPSGLASHALARTRSEGFRWASIGYSIYRHRAMAMTVLSLLASWRARRNRKLLEREEAAFEAVTGRANANRHRANGSDKGASEMGNNLKDTTSMAREKIRAAADTAAERAASLRHTAGEKAGEAYSYTRAKSSDVIERMRENPVTTILGGVALGVLAGVLLPRLRSRPAHQRTAERYRAGATEVARETLNAIGNRLDKLNVNRETARATVAKARELVQGATMTAGRTARDAVEQVKRDV